VSFSTQIADFVRSSTLNAGIVVKETVKALGDELIDRSPVGDPANWKSTSSPPKSYVPGHFIANWQHGYQTMNASVRPISDETGQVSAGQIRSSVSSVGKPEGVHYLYNNVPYAMVLENGWSDQAPQGMVALTVIGAKATVERIASRIRR